MSKPQINISNKYDRVIVLIDMDCFYCQVEEKLNPDLKGKPIAVVQYNAWRGGGIIAVNYPARDKGVTRHMRGDEAKGACPDIELVKVPNIREKADLSKYRDAGKEVAEVLKTFTPLLERASVDEAYLDITENVQSRLLEMNAGKFQLRPDILVNTYALGYKTIGEYVHDISTRMSQADGEDALIDVPVDDQRAYRKSDIKLLIGSSIVNEIRGAVKEQTGYECSAGIAHNKILAKLVCGMNKPNKQTILPLGYIKEMYRDLSLKKVKGLGGKFGDELCENLAIEKMGELIRFSKEELQRRFDERNGLWLFNISRGIDLEAVTPRFSSKSIGCCKKFPGRNAITGVATLKHWLQELAREICDRLEKDELENNRRPKQMVVSYMQTINGQDISSSRSVALPNFTIFEDDKIAAEALDVLKKNTDKFLKSPDNLHLINNPIKFLGISVGKFENLDSKQGNTIQDLFRKNIEAKKTVALEENKMDVNSKDETVKNPVVEKPVLRIRNDDDTDSKKEEEDVTERPKTPQKTIKKSFFANLIRPIASTSVKSDSNTTTAPTLDLQKSPTNDTLVDKNNSIEETPNTSLSESKQNVPDYTETYAEFQRPSLPQCNIPLIVCSQCGKSIKENQLQTHTDAHLAFQLSQEQRVEFRSQLMSNSKSNAPTSPPPAKKVKSSHKSSTAAPVNSSLSIDKFLIKKTKSFESDKKDNEASTSFSSNEPSTSTSLGESDKEMCNECNKMIPVSEIIEHMDFHVAKNLQKELQREQLAADRRGSRREICNNNTITKKNKSINNKNKRKSNSAGASNAGGNAVNVKSVASFFTK